MSTRLEAALGEVWTDPPDTRTMISAAARELAERTCAEQGLELEITDRSVLATIGALLWTHKRDASSPKLASPELRRDADDLPPAA